MNVNKSVAGLMEHCIKETHIAFTRLYPQGQVMELNGGAACFAGADSFFSQVIGWGFATKIKQLQAELTAIETFYRSLGHKRVDIELCPYVGSEFAAALSQRGYGISELNNVAVYDVTSHRHQTFDHPFELRMIQPDEGSYWAKKMALAFGYPEAEEQFSYYIRAEGVTTFGVFHQGELIAGATIAVHGEVGDLGVTSTVPAFRRRGLHQQLLMARLNFAKKLGLSLATVTTAPGSISDLNVQKAGFRCAYTRIKMSL